MYQSDNALTFREFVMKEEHPLAALHAAVLEFLSGREDAVVFGAQAVNAYVDEPRMTQDIDILSPSACELAEAIRRHLAERFHIAVRTRELNDGRDFRVYQVRKPRNRHLVDLRSVDVLPPRQRIGGILVPTPAELVAEKVMAWRMRRNHPKAGTDWRDIAMMLLVFPDLKTADGPVREALMSQSASPEVLTAWDELVEMEIAPEEESW